MTLEPIDFLGACVERGDFCATEAQWRSQIGNLFDVLLKNDLLQGPSWQEEMLCTFCDQPGHSAFVRYDDDEQQYLVYCVARGGTYLHPSDVELWSFRVDSFLAGIGGILGIEKMDGRIRRSGGLVRLGTGKLGRTTFGVYLLSGLADPATFNDFLSRNRTGFGPVPSIVLSAAVPTLAVEDIGKHPLVKFGDILNFEQDGFTLKDAGLRHALGLKRAGKKRAPALESAVQVFSLMIKDGDKLPPGYPNLKKAFERSGPKDMATPGRSTLFKARKMALSNVT